MGKTFREGIIRWFPKNDIKSVDAVILTHGHADAIFGLDDLRSVQMPKIKTPVYLTDECLQIVRNVFFYLFPTISPNKVDRFVSSIQWNTITPFVPFTACGIEILPIPVIHGEDMISMGFLFGKKDRVCYISDISRMPPYTLEAIHKHQPKIDILILDCLTSSYKHPTHFNLNEALDLVRELKPKKTYFVGMSSSMEHEENNALCAKLKESEGLDVELSYDGLVVDIDL